MYTQAWTEVILKLILQMGHKIWPSQCSVKTKFTFCEVFQLTSQLMYL